MRQFGELEAVIMDRVWERGRLALVRVLLALIPAIAALALGRVPAA
jgi:hypothetical protein